MSRAFDKPVVARALGALIDQGFTIDLRCRACGYVTRPDLSVLAKVFGRDRDIFRHPLPAQCDMCRSRELDVAVNEPGAGAR